jgi:O-antigen ligase
VDAWRSRLLRFNRNALQWPLLGLFLLGLFQLLPLGGQVTVETGQLLSAGVEPVKSLSLDPYATRLVLVQLLALFVYFAAVLAFTDSPRRLRVLVRTIIIFGFALAIFGLIQSFTSPTKVYWLRELQQSTPFGPFINRHHFAGYMEMTLALPLGLLFSGAIEKDKRMLYIFAAALMGVALIMTGSRGGIISLGALVLFLAALTGFGLRRKRGRERHGPERPERVGQKGMAVRALLALGLVLAFLTGTILLGGESGLSRFVGSVNSEDPTTGRAHFWSVTLDIIHHHPVLGTGLGAFGVVYTRYDSRNGMYRLDQAHNDYLQIVSDGGIVGLALGLFFVIALFRMGLAECRSDDTFRRGVAMGALAGCFAVLVHSFFDFTLHTTANALLFLTMAALATLRGRVEQVEHGGHRRRLRRSPGSRTSGERAEAMREGIVAP